MADQGKEEKPTDESHPAEPIEQTDDETSFASATAHPRQVMVTDDELKSLQKELVEYKDKYLRLLADAENARKRLQKERQEITRYAIENLILDFLKPIDNFENALRFAQDMSEEVKNWAYGFQMILSQFKDSLSQHGIISLDSLGKPFDPHEHEAVEMVETDKEPPGTIIEECVRGYRLGDRTIRAARVKVAKAAESSAADQE